MPSSDRPAPRRSRPKAIAVAVAVVIAGAAALAITLAVHPAPAPTPPAPVTYSTASQGWVLPALKGGAPVRLSDFRGSPTVVVFFASWCTACQDELPVFAATAKRVDSHVHFVGVDSLETSDGNAMARQYGIDSWPLAVDVNGSAASGLHDAVGAVGMPATVFYSADGTVLFRAQGAMTQSSLDAELMTQYGIPANS